METRTKETVFVTFICIICGLCIACSSFFIWQIIEGFKESSAWGWGTNAFVVLILFVIGILGICSSVRKHPQCLASFFMMGIIICIVCAAEIGITAWGVSQCGKYDSEDVSDIISFICSSSSWVVLIPTGGLFVGMLIAIIFASKLRDSVEDTVKNNGNEGAAYYPT